MSSGGVIAAIGVLFCIVGLLFLADWYGFKYVPSPYNLIGMIVGIVGGVVLFGIGVACT